MQEARQTLTNTTHAHSSDTSAHICAHMQALVKLQHAGCACAGGVAVIFDKQQLILLEDCQEMMVRARIDLAWCSVAAAACRGLRLIIRSRVGHLVVLRR